MEKKTTITYSDLYGKKSFVLEYFTQQPIVIGSGSDSDICIVRPRVSEHHGCFYRENGLWFYKDLNSETGTNIDGIPAFNSQVHDGMNIVLDSDIYPDSAVVTVSIETDYEKQVVAAGSSLNLWGLLAAVLWAAFGLYNLYSFFQVASEISATTSVLSAYSTSAALFIWLMIICEFVYIVGMLLLAVGLFIYNKKFMFIGSAMMAGGMTGMFASIMLGLMTILGGYFLTIMINFKVLLAILALVAMLAGFISLAKNFKTSYDGMKVGKKWSRPIIYYATAWLVLLFVGLLSATSFSAAIESMAGSLPTSNILLTIGWLGATVLSCVYLYVDEKPELAMKYKIGH